MQIQRPTGYMLEDFKGFKLFLSVVAGFKNRIRNEVNRYGRRKTLNMKKIDSNARYFLQVPVLNKRIKRNRIVRQLGSVIFLLRHLL